MIFKHEAVIDGQKFKAEVYTSQSAAEFLGVSIGTLYRMEKRGDIKCSFTFPLGKRNIRAYMREYLERSWTGIKKRSECKSPSDCALGLSFPFPSRSFIKNIFPD